MRTVTTDGLGNNKIFGGLLSYSISNAITNQGRNYALQSRLTLETFRFKDENDYEYEISLKVFSRILKIQTPRKASFYHSVSLEKLALLPLVKEVTHSPDRKMIKLPTSDNSFSPLRHSR